MIEKLCRPGFVLGKAMEKPASQKCFEEIYLCRVVGISNGSFRNILKASMKLCEKTLFSVIAGR